MHDDDWVVTDRSHLFDELVPSSPKREIVSVSPVAIHGKVAFAKFG